MNRRSFMKSLGIGLIASQIPMPESKTTTDGIISYIQVNGRVWTNHEIDKSIHDKFVKQSDYTEMLEKMFQYGSPNKMVWLKGEFIEIQD